MHDAAPDSLLALLHTRLALEPGRRLILGLAGPPGAGKSSLAQALAHALPGRAVVVPMDGFHLAGSELERLGLAARKGAADTFDSAGYVALLQRLRQRRPGQVIYAPDYRRDLHEAVAGAIAVAPECELVITEGNYLLLDQGNWSEVRALLDLAWYVDPDPLLRRQRLEQRHVRFGSSVEQARLWIEQTDEPNARLIESTRRRADLLLR
ncbi:nucleoside/nucleotide kinase family protein [Massilia sp. CCM 8733]|uniref:Nucleoside/nucleotide kinase family protein n=1 Tax=Massilia mucilaginosa TaxID=2609282 RepID=A0ABX0NX21_9BURK|nr:nucleoside/nucleotide kinase family protein [Massilia mucilaginosa]